MNRQEAAAEARLRWGTAGNVFEFQFHGPTFVLSQMVRGRHEERGAGPSWVAAFADADRRATVAQ